MGAAAGGGAESRWERLVLDLDGVRPVLQVCLDQLPETVQVGRAHCTKVLHVPWRQFVREREREIKGSAL